MNLILDANALIYLIKLNLQEKFMEYHKKSQIFIDTSVYTEVVEKGLKNNYPDAITAKKFLQNYKIPIIPIDVSEHIHKFRDAGETSCAILALNKKTEGVCISSDKKAIKKFAAYNIPYTQLDTVYYNLFLKAKLREEEFFNILYKLEKIFAINSERIIFFYDLINKKRNQEKKMKEKKEKREENE